MIKEEDLYWYKIKNIVKVYDGDTITVDIDLGMGITRREVIRFYGINTPEIRGESREQGLISRDWLSEKLLNASQVYVKTYLDKSGKYGRLLGELYINSEEVSLNEQLVQEGLAVYY